MGLLEHTYRSKRYRMPSADGDILLFLFRKALWANQLPIDSVVEIGSQVTYVLIYVT